MIKLKPYRFALLWLALITVLSTMPTPQLPEVKVFAPDKVVHFAIYAVLAWLLSSGYLRTQGQAAHRYASWAIFLVASCYGVLMEFVQYAFIPGRFYEYGDMLANAAGAAGGAFTNAWFWNLQKTA